MLIQQPPLKDAVCKVIIVDMLSVRRINKEGFAMNENTYNDYYSPLDLQPTPPVPDFDRASARKVFSRIGFALAVYIIGSFLFPSLLVLLAYELDMVLDGTIEWFYKYYSPVAFVTSAFLGFVFFHLVAGKLPRDSRIAHYSLEKGDMLKAGCASISGVYVGGLIATLLMTAVNAFLPTPLEDPLVNMVGTTEPWGLFVTVCILAPVIEELLFRKLLLDRLSVFGDRTAIFVGSLCFALYHCNIYQFFYAMLLGMVFSWVYLRSGKILLTMTLHAIINFMGGIITPYFQEQLGVFSGDLESAMTVANVEIENLLPAMLASIYSLAMVGIAITGIVLVCWKWKTLFFAPANNPIPKGRGFSTAILNPGMITFVVITLLLVIYQFVAL